MTNHLDEREVFITIDYPNDLIIVYSNDFTILNRLDRKGFKHYSEQTNKKGQVLARQYKLPIDQMGKFLQVGLYKR